MSVKFMRRHTAISGYGAASKKSYIKIIDLIRISSGTSESNVNVLVL